MTDCHAVGRLNREFGKASAAPIAMSLSHAVGASGTEESVIRDAAIAPPNSLPTLMKPRRTDLSASLVPILLALISCATSLD